MSYFIARMLERSFDDAIARVTDALRAEGFGVLTDIDVSSTLRQKLGVTFRRYRILGACNPALAYEALQREDKVGTMLPCNVIVQDAGNGRTEIAAVDPIASMTAIDNPELRQVAETVRGKLRKVIEAV
jgi:uncharacterized protein (DUF302 family)